VNKSFFKTLVLAISVTTLLVALIKFPKDGLEASTRGVDMWWEIVFPSLLPFFIISELLISFGVVAFVGVLLEPLMRPLFRVPGSGGFIWAMGMASGFPSGAKWTARLRSEGQITKVEAERLVSFTNSSNPLFIFGAVSVGFFHNTALGLILAISHYAGNFIVGLIMRFHGKHEKNNRESKKRSFKHAFIELHKTRIKETRPLGKILGDAVISSIETLMMIGGFIVIFSVINKLLYIMNFTEMIAFFFNYLLSLLQIPTSFSIPLISGIFEITLGSQLTSNVEAAPLLMKAIIVSFILGFSGISVHAQVASILAQTDIRFAPFFFARILHGVIASIITLIIWKPLYEGSSLKEGLPNVISVNNTVFDPDLISSAMNWLSNLGPIVTIAALLLYILLYFKKTIDNR